MAKKYTPWFDRLVKPTRKGVYQVRMRHLVNHPDEAYSYWDGKRWGWVYSTVKDANTFRDTHGSYQSKDWRGITQFAALGV